MACLIKIQTFWVVPILIVMNINHKSSIEEQSKQTDGDALPSRISSVYIMIQ